MKLKKSLSIALSLSLLLGTVPVQYSNSAAAESNDAVPSVTSAVYLPQEPVWGHFVDNYKNNISVNNAVYSNPAIGVLSGFHELWTPGDSWDNGTKLNSEVLDYNIQYVVDLSKTRTAEDEERAYYDDRRNQTYGATEGLGALADVYRSLSGTATTITDIPADATSVKYSDNNPNGNKGGDSNSELGKMVDLIGKVRGNYASTNPAKGYYQYKRPWRWAGEEIITPTLYPVRSMTPEKDGGFPSGHTNASYLASLSLAYAVPERFQEMMTRASEMGNSRIVAGMHSPLDVIGGRVMATALAAAALNDPENAELKQAAYDQAHNVLLKQNGTAEDRFSDYEKNKAQYIERLTYGFKQINPTNKPMVVPKGAEVLIETRLPYLDGEQRRAVLATTGLPSGYPVLDDPEGWGRLNLFAAADGYGAFNSDVVVTMDADQGGFHTLDRWRNDISGSGKLTKEGTGTLILQGSNTYAGGTVVNGGTLQGESAAAFGTGDVAVGAGTLAEEVDGKIGIGGNYTQAAEGTLELNVGSAADVLEVKGAVQAGGKLLVNFTDSYVPASGSVITLMTHAKDQRTGQFSTVETTGLSDLYSVRVTYQSDRIELTVNEASAPAWGHFVDTYKNNTSANQSVESNPAIGVLSGFHELWTPGDSWDNGTKLNSEVLDYNIQYVVDLSKTRTAEDEERAYYDDRRNQTYGATEGLGALADVYRSLSGTATTITDIPADATSVKYSDNNPNGNKGGDSNSELGKMVDLIGKVRGNYASTNPAKGYYQYKRPWRWAGEEIITPTLYPVRSMTPEKDGGFPSGHTNASYLASLALAYAVPERYQEMMTRASEMGNSRIVAGMHSPLDVIGGRVMATALAAAALNDPENAELKQAAYDQAHNVLLKQNGTAEDRFSDYEKNKAQYIERLTYGFKQINPTNKPMVVPKGAEVLIETRLPYLDGEQRRAVLATTGLPSGYPVLDDPEGWGRLNLFAAADGYGAFNSDVVVTMDADQGGFHALDRWRNDISGSGKLTKEGTGTLILQGSNTYAGGTVVNGGTLQGESAAAFGTGDVAVGAGTLAEEVDGKIGIGGNYTQAAEGTLELNVGSAADVLEVKGAVQAGGKLLVNFTDSYVPASGSVITLMTHAKDQRTGQFASVETTGLPASYKVQVTYLADRVQLAVNPSTTTPSAPGYIPPVTGSTPVDTNKPAGDAIPAAGSQQKQSISAAAKVDANGRAVAELQAAHLSDLLDKVNALTGADLVAEIKVEAASGATAAVLSLTKEALGKLADSKADEVLITTQFGSMTLNKAVLNNLKNASGETIRIEMAAADTSAFSGEARSLIGTRPALDFTIQSGDSAVTSFGGSSIKLGIPYQLPQGEDASALVVSHIDSNGAVHLLPKSGYSQRDGQMYVVTDHLSTYAVSYNKASFNDTAAHWANSHITHLAARGIVSGSGSGKFSPNATITRAEFAKMLAGLVSADVSKYSSSAFTDVEAGDWFMPYVAWAAENGIVKGTNKQFRPTDRISREEMSVMLIRLADLTGYKLPAVAGAASFADQSLISAWAADAVSDLYEAGIISGKGNQNFDPQGGATRAEAAKMLTMLLQGMTEQQ